MKPRKLLWLGLFIFSLVSAQDSSARLNYADFEKLDKDNRPMSAREGKIIFGSTAENNNNKPKIAPKLFPAQAPLTQRLGFDFELSRPNNYASAFVKIIGMKDKGRLDDAAKTLIVKSEDVSDYKYLSLDIGAVGVSQVRIDLISEGNGIDTNANQEKFLDIDGQIKNYKIPISDFKQATGSWVNRKVTIDQVVRKLTAIQINVVQIPSKGIVVIDNVAFEK